jgi:hypothetical protein
VGLGEAARILPNPVAGARRDSDAFRLVVLSGLAVLFVLRVPASALVLLQGLADLTDVMAVGTAGLLTHVNAVYGALAIRF